MRSSSIGPPGKRPPGDQPPRDQPPRDQPPGQPLEQPLGQQALGQPPLEQPPLGQQPPGGFEHIILPHLDAAYNLARWLVRDPTLAEDVVQEAALRAVSYFASYKGGDGRAWLLRIVRNSAYSAMAARRSGNTTSLDDAVVTDRGEAAVLQVADPGDNPEVALGRREGFARLDEALAALPEELRECLVLHELEELSYKQVAEITGVPIGTVMSRLWRARRALIGHRAEGET